jgi:hypothetical protein
VRPVLHRYQLLDTDRDAVQRAERRIGLEPLRGRPGRRDRPDGVDMGERVDRRVQMLMTGQQTFELLDW